MGLFGTPSTAQPQQATGGLFGGTPSTAQNQASTSGTSGGLFGAPSAAQNQPATGGGGGGLFGAPATAQNQPANTGGAAGGLFGSSTQNQPANTGGAAGGLFGSSTQNQPANTGGGGLFGSSTQNQPANTGGGGLFGSSTQNQPAAAGGLFGSATQNQPATSGIGLSGTTAFSQTTAQPSTFGASSLFGQPAAAQPAQGATASNTASGLFGATVQQPQQQQQQPQQAQPTASVNGGALPQGNTNGYFDSLLSKSKRQANGESPLEDLPSLQLGLGDLRQRLRKLGPRAADPLQHGKAQYMLAASGVDPGAAVKDLGFFNVQGTRADRPVPGPAASEVDVEAYLANLQTKTTLSMISDGLERSVRDFDRFLEDNVHMEWDAQRRRIYDHFGIKVDDTPADHATGSPRESQGGFGRSRRNPKSARSTTSGTRASTFGRSNLQGSVIGTPSRIGFYPAFKDGGDNGDVAALNGGSTADDRFLREKQTKLAGRVRQLNLSRLQGEPYPILAELADLESKSGDRHAAHLVDAYRALISIVGEDPDAETFAGDATAKERSFKDLHMTPSDKSPSAITMRKKILAGALKYLESKFFQQMETLVFNNQRESNLGGRPDVVSKIKAYVRVRAGRRDLVGDKVELQEVEGEFIWAHVYFLLRSGRVDDAAEYVKSKSNVFRSIDRTFQSYLLEYASSPDKRLRRPLQDRCNNEYGQRIRNAPAGSVDPYRMACYKIVGRCDVGNRTLDGINTDIEDWIWLQFNLARENERTLEVAGESFTLSDLQQSIQEIGKRHFPKAASDDTNGQFGMYFFLQILSGMFEQAIAYLYSFSYVDAIHFAIGLEYYGLIRPSDPWTTQNELLSYDTRGNAQLSFGRLMGYYTRDFRAADVASAIDYLVLICLNADIEGEAGRQQKELCHMALRDIILESREFSKLIGDIRPDGRRITGLIEQRGPLIGLQQEDDFIKAVTLQAARFADDNGRTTDAVLLYHLAGEYDSVVSIISRALSEAVSLEIGQDPMRLEPVKPRGSDKDPETPVNSSLSLASMDDPVKLASTMVRMYEQDAMFFSKISEENRTACDILLRMSEIKGMVGAGQWPESLDRIKGLKILPLDAHGDAAAIRHYAAKFGTLSQPVAANVPALLLWTVTCCVQERRQHAGEHLGIRGRNGGVANEGTRQLLINECKQITLDLATYTGQLRYRFPPRLHEALARASAE